MLEFIRINQLRREYWRDHPADYERYQALGAQFWRHKRAGRLAQATAALQESQALYAQSEAWVKSQLP